MDCGGFLVKGSRPPSAMSDQRPNSSPSKHHGYHVVSRTSFADESLFGSVHPSKLNNPVNSFKAPWEYPKPVSPGNTYASVRHYKAVIAANKEKPKTSPLLWSPTPGSSKFVVSNVKSSKNAKFNSNDNSCPWNTRSHFRHLKHTPTFVDESLFGKKLEQPTFEAPWNNYKKEDNTKFSEPFLWDASGNSQIQAHNGVEIDLGESQRPLTASRRPKSALGVSRKNDKTLCNSKPVWKP